MKIAILITVSFVVYYPILFNDLLYALNDQWPVMNRFNEGGIYLANLRTIFTEFYGCQFSPINQSLYLPVYSLFGIGLSFITVWYFVDFLENKKDFFYLFINL